MAITVSPPSEMEPNHKPQTTNRLLPKWSQTTNHRPQILLHTESSDESIEDYYCMLPREEHRQDRQTDSNQF